MPLDSFSQTGLQSAAQTMLANTPLHPLAPVLGKWFEEDLRRIQASIRGTDVQVFRETLASLDIGYECASGDAANIPLEGPVLVVANHPFGLVEGLVLGALLAEIRPVRFFANSMLHAVPALRDYVFPVNPFGGAAAIRENQRSLRQGIACLRAGRLLVVFPAGEVAPLRLPDMAIPDPEWTKNAVSRIEKIFMRRAGSI